MYVLINPPESSKAALVSYLSFSDGLTNNLLPSFSEHSILWSSTGNRSATALESNGMRRSNKANPQERVQGDPNPLQYTS